MPRKGEQPIPGYRLERFLGRGGFGEVWRAQAPGGTNIALKFIGLEGKAGLKEFRAIQSVKEIRHANLLPIHAFWMLNEEGDVLDDAMLSSPDAITSLRLSANKPVQLVAAFLLGDQNLEERLRDSQAEGHAGIPLVELVPFMSDAARGIDFLNSPRHDLGQGVVAIQHCDIKPQNIMVVGDSAMICDFGLAKALGSNRSISGVAGSPSYMAPECINGKPPTETTDQYSLAISYFHLRTGKLPFVDQSFPAVLNAHMQGNLDLATLSEPEQEVIRRAIHLDPTRRFSSCGEMVEKLRVATDSADVKSKIAQLNDTSGGTSEYNREILSTVVSNSLQIGEHESEVISTSGADTTRDFQLEVDSKPDVSADAETSDRSIMDSWSALPTSKKSQAIGLSFVVCMTFIVHSFELLISTSSIIESGTFTTHGLILSVALVGVIGDGVGAWATVDIVRGDWLRGIDKLVFYSTAACASIYVFIAYS